MEVIVYGKEDCGKCEAAKEKLEKMGFPYTSKDLEYYTTFHEGWKTDGSVQILAESTYWEGTLPLICIDGDFLDYPSAMKSLKTLKRSQRVSRANQTEAALV